jgi:hypothetical protein
MAASCNDSCDLVSGSKLTRLGHLLHRSMRHDPFPLQRPCFVDDVAGVIAQQPLQFGALRLRVAAHVAIEGRKRGGFVANRLVNVGKILIRGHGEKAEQKSVDDSEVLVGDGTSIERWVGKG